MIAQFGRDAMREVIEAMAYLDQQRAGLGDELYAEVNAAIKLIMKQPDLWPIYLGDIRRYRLKRFRYHINYRFDSHLLTVIAFTHTSRKPGYWMDRI